MSVPLRITPVPSFEHIRDEWIELAESAGGIFATYEWAETWWLHHGEGKELLLHACRDDAGALVAVLPLYAWRALRLRVIRFLGHGQGDELGPVHAPGRGREAAEALRRALDDLDWDIAFCEQLPGTAGWSLALGGRLWRREASPILTFAGGGWGTFLTDRSANFRQQVSRRQRELERAAAVTFRLAGEKSLERDLDTLFALHQARFGGRRSDFSDTAFHRAIARRALARGRLRLWLLELDGQPVAAWHGFHAGGITNYYQAGRDLAYDRLSPGFVLMAHSIRQAIEEGAAEYRFGRGSERYKYRFADDDPGLETIVLTRGGVGRAALVTGRAARRSRSLIYGIRRRIVRHRLAV